MITKVIHLIRQGQRTYKTSFITIYFIQDTYSKEFKTYYLGHLARLAVICFNRSL